MEKSSKIFRGKITQINFEEFEGKDCQRNTKKEKRKTKKKQRNKKRKNE